MKILHETDRDLLTLVVGAAADGIAVEGLVTNASAIGLKVTREGALAICRKLAKSGHIEFKGVPARVYATDQGAEAIRA